LLCQLSYSGATPDIVCALEQNLAGTLVRDDLALHAL
jgi:hypothetical protein